MNNRALLIILIILFLTLLSFTLTNIKPQTIFKNETGIVTRAIDGDTLVLGNNQTVRLLGINTPEKNKFKYQEAKDFLKQLEGREIIIIRAEENTDQYNRLLRYIYYNNSLVNQEILRNGLAHIYYYEYDSYYNKLKSAETQAQKSNLGIWIESKNICASCINLTKLNNIDPGEYIILKNTCNFSCNLNNYTIKDDANHFKTLNFILNAEQEKQIDYNGSIWNDDKDTLFLRDEKGNLVLFYRYGYL